MNDDQSKWFIERLLDQRWGAHLIPDIEWVKPMRATKEPSMSSVGGIDCPICGDCGPLHVDKRKRLINWGLQCMMCGHYLGDGSYWLSVKGGWRAHCESLRWDDKLQELDNKMERFWNKPNDERSES